VYAPDNVNEKKIVEGSGVYIENFVRSVGEWQKTKKKAARAQIRIFHRPRAMEHGEHIVAGGKATVRVDLDPNSGGSVPEPIRNGFGTSGRRKTLLPGM